jgi:hypothetical protein
VGERPAPVTRFSVGLLVAGTLSLAGVFLSANPRYGFAHAVWPWELLTQSPFYALRATVALLAVAGAWALVSALGIAPRSRGVIGLALGAVLVLVCTSETAMEMRVSSHVVQFHTLVVMIAAAAGLEIARRGGKGATMRALAFVGGLALVWWTLHRVDGERVLLARMTEDLWAAVRGELTDREPTFTWHVLVPLWASFLAGVFAVLAAMRVAPRVFGWTGLALLVVVFLAPPVRDFVVLVRETSFGELTGAQWAGFGGRAIVTSGLAVWLLGTFAAADATWNRGGVS